MNIEICDDIGCADYNCQKCMRKSTTMNTKRKGYSKKEVKLADKLLSFLARRNPRKQFCSFIEPTTCDVCEEKIEIVRFLLKEGMKI